MSMDSKKSNKIRDIVRLQQIIKKWRKLANNSSKTTTTSKSIKFLIKTLSLSDNSTREGSSTVVPKGYLAVCVGDELKRFIVPTAYLSHHAFQVLLQEAEEEFGFQQSGVLRIPCEVCVFESILKVVEGKDIYFTKECRLSIEEMVGYCSSESQLTHSHHPHSPMCR
ncbi:SAUR-like auxin-responsive family protein [Quillaja saponaria]|uniref:SAUR-like auxin-responsive family protein n=1 Tax=Quillaja saponaria TaxID=32244 RepID=A0AAD7LID6_QUISA|nr:SAUR-like auxin-responsive family protein [Quillaja saponaria]